MGGGNVADGAYAQSGRMRVMRGNGAMMERSVMLANVWSDSGAIGAMLERCMCRGAIAPSAGAWTVCQYHLPLTLRAHRHGQ